jgi:hypothetical protein
MTTQYVMMNSAGSAVFFGAEAISVARARSGGTTPPSLAPEPVWFRPRGGVITSPSSRSPL